MGKRMYEVLHYLNNKHEYKAFVGQTKIVSVAISCAVRVASRADNCPVLVRKIHSVQMSLQILRAENEPWPRIW